MKYLLQLFILLSVSSLLAQQNDFVLLRSLSNDFVFDMKYATPDNFLKQAVYDCGECYLRKSTAKALVKANEEFKSLGYHIKLFDGYLVINWKILLKNITLLSTLLNIPPISSESMFISINGKLIFSKKGLSSLIAPFS